MGKRNKFRIFENLVGDNVFKIQVDNKTLDLSFLEAKVFIGERVEIELSSGVQISFFTDDLPHFYGEADIEFLYNVSQHKSDETKEFIISKIKIWEWEPKGLNLFNRKNFVQVEFFTAEDHCLSIGFFTAKIDNKVEFIGTGEIAINCCHHLPEKVNKRFINSIVFS